MASAMRKDIENYLRSSAYDFATARRLLRTGRYLYVVFMCHLSLEKLLKAAYSERLDRSAPRTHNLLHLLKETGVELPSEHLAFVSMINNASVVTRYPADFSAMVSSYPRRVARDYVRKTDEVLSWLRRLMKWK